MNAIVTLTIAGILVLLGRWGYRNAENLAPPLLAEESREHRTRVVRRGAIACYAAAVVFVAIAIIGTTA